MFLGTEFGVYFTNKKSKVWTKFSNGLPNISVRDIAIQKRENDLVLGTFGRGIFILDDYSSLRNFNASDMENEAKLFSPRDSYWYKQKRPLGGRKKASQGDNYFVAESKNQSFSNPSYHAPPHVFAASVVARPCQRVARPRLLRFGSHIGNCCRNLSARSAS